ncbi:hypothetical protein CC85DRAFT_271822 [Cutaneotrichosporon oleaginosum]|uniref:Uncharacterized protein n=1 Tax=Cutaneotrichosporon oleaginosum TaxID=879819 RepID=A0A0J0XSC6_9TREE|nr:uncharacterized protein CC85DRAFT_271822 [Cutaneotrichosporon oleaginosum]KLT43971.1 hypothetical protein CC85DRAFT_271822 [Cutaneotrichosporon oleaginosum]TXT04081.1 hypothetical protein COLE_07778 [Cutaneotrichosporon oleaginosum]
MGKFSFKRSSGPPRRAAEAPPPPYQPNVSSSEAGPSTSTPDSRSSHEQPVAYEDVKHPPPSGDPPPFACIILGNTDRISILRLPPHLVPALSDAIVSAWPQGISRGEAKEQGWEWKLRGMPMRDYLVARRIVFALLTTLYAAGWHIRGSANLSKEDLGKDSVFLRAGPPCTKRFFAVGLCPWDRVRIVDPPSEEVRNAFLRVVRTWHKGIQEIKEKDSACLDIKLRGSPFGTGDRGEQASARLLMLDLLGVLETLGYELVVCMQLTTSFAEEDEQPQTWLFANAAPV